MKCQNCGNRVKNNNRFCTSCGQPILVAVNLTNYFKEEEPILYQQAIDCYRNRKYEQAKINLFELILKHPNNSKYQNLLGCVYLRQDKDNLAILHFEKAIQLNKNSWQSYYNLGIIFSKQENYQRAKEMFKAVLRFNEQHWSSIYNLGTIFLKEGNYREAVIELTKVHKINPYHNNNRINLNLALKKLKD